MNSQVYFAINFIINEGESYKNLKSEGKKIKNLPQIVFKRNPGISEVLEAMHWGQC
jgi:hypothetical protein